MLKTRNWGIGLLAILTAGGCATVHVQKVPTPTQYATWSDAQQSAADKMEGLRFYLPRPFVNVFQSFPVAADLYIADGEISPDGQYVIIQNVRSESPLGRFFTSPAANGVIPGVKVPNAMIGAPTEAELAAVKELTQPLASPHAGQTADAAALAQKMAEAALKTSDTAAATAKLAQQDAEKAATQPARAPVEDTGKNKRKVTNDNAAFAYQPLRGSLEIVYLPDFEEQYVVSSNSGLGNAQFEVALGQGWSLQGFDSLSDNTQLNKLMYELIGTAADAAKALATQGTSLGVEAIASAATKLATPHAGGLQPQETPGTKVSLRISVIYYAAKGLYPVIKPRELKDQPRSAFLMDLADQSRVGAGLRAITDPVLQSEIARADANRSRFSVPVYPYQYISFNTFRYMSVDVLTKNGLPFGTLYPDQGTVANPNAPTPPPVVANAKPVADENAAKKNAYLRGKNPAVTTAVQKAFAENDTLKNLTVEKVMLELGGAAEGGKKQTIKATVFVKPVQTSLSSDFKKAVTDSVTDVLGSDANSPIPEFEVEPNAAPAQ